MFQAILIILLLTLKSTISDNNADLFGKGSHLDKLVLVDHIGYHLKKPIREVKQELFVSRKIDVSALFAGIQVLNITNLGVKSFCQGLGASQPGAAQGSPREATYAYLRVPHVASFAEAKAKCAARGMQLPEVYTEHQQYELTAFLQSNDIKFCFAGIQPDLTDAIARFISTGLPMWKSPYKSIYQPDGSYVAMTNLLDDIHVKFLYTDENKMVFSADHPSIATSNKHEIGSHTYWENNKVFSQLKTKIVCEPKWDGYSYQTGPGDAAVNVPDLTIAERVLRDAPIQNSKKTLFALTDMQELLGIINLEEYCYSVALQADELQKDMTEKLTKLLSMVDITVQLENNQEVQPREKRAAFLMKFVFSTGIRLIWNIFGFLDRMRTNRRLKKLEKSMVATKALAEANQKDIAEMSKVIYGNSIAIQQLKVTTASLDKRLTEVEEKVYNIERTLADNVHKMEVMLSLSLIVNLISRIQHSLNTGYDTLKDIIHCSLVGQTSPLLLPIDQIKIVQAEIRKDSSGILDTDFANMQSIVVSDPNDSHLLLVVINVAALSQTYMTLVKLVPIPYYEGTQTFIPMLDYNTVVVDWSNRKYSILSEQEESDCLFNRCYISDAERTITEKSCGIPQFWEQQRNGCLADSMTSTGIFLKPMLPDGIIFAFRKEVSVQLFCEDNRKRGPLRKLNGTGVMQLPNGCTLNVDEETLGSTKVKGQPLYKMLEADDLNLVMNGPLNVFHAIDDNKTSQKLATYSSNLNDQLSSVVKQVSDVDSKLANQATFTWSLIGVTSLIIMLVAITAVVIYSFSGKFKRKIYDLRDKFAEIMQKFSDIEDNDVSLRRGFPPLPAPRPALNILLNRPRTKHSDTSTYLSMEEIKSRKNSELQAKTSSFSPVQSVPDGATRHYPRLTPLLKKLSDMDIESESQEVDSLCNRDTPFSGQTHSKFHHDNS